jgi:ribonuclease J
VAPLEEVAGLPPARQLILSTGSQGEPNSALALMAAGEHKYVQVERGDLVIISARVIPGNERTVGRVINALFRLGAEVLYEDNAFVHVSGHASQEDLKLMLTLTRPRYFVPVHGEYRHLLGHAQLAESAGLTPDRIFVIEDGQGVELTKTTARLLTGFPTGRVFVDGKGVGDVGPVVLRDRQLLAQDGMIVVSLALDAAGTVLAGPDLASRGVVYVKESEEVLAEIRAAVLEALAARDPAEALDREVTRALVKSAVRRFVKARFNRKPVVLAVVLEVGRLPD